ncbi:MAG: hypothetical protein ACT4PT_04370 [Methanobacteriota archaeon]
MATSPVRIGDEHKAELERLRDAVAGATGTRASQQDVLGAAIEFALRHRDEFVTETAWRPLSEEEIRGWRERVAKMRGWKAVRPEDIDDVVYGNP